ncbi:PEP-CTERM sorting domain-containing protein [Haloferula sp.]|uniref:PEP-CTERM sorting domain-containing protein n=1 Tax=Haloferula sp. TaxID=2497595 RepID=UPI003C77BFD4
MKKTTSNLTKFALGAFAFGALSSANATLVSYESFDYPPPGDPFLDGSNGGLGFSSSWRGSGLIDAGSLTGTAGTLTPGGNKGLMDINGRAWRNLSTSYNDSVTQTIYVSLLMRDGTLNATDYTVFEMFNGDDGDPSRAFQLGLIAGDGPNDGNIYSKVNNTALSSSLGAATTNSDFYLIQFDLVNGADDTVSVWRNPGITPGLADGTITVPSIAFDRIAFAAFGGNPDQALDEFRLGTELVDVLAVPEPTSASLVILVMGATLLRRKR